MTNKKIKSNMVQQNMKGRAAFRETGRNLMTFYLAVRSTKLSIKQIKQFDHAIIIDEVKKFRQDSHDGVIDKRVDNFLKNVDIPRSRFDAFVMMYNAPHIKGMFNQQEYDVVIDALATDLAVYCLLLNKYYGYGHTRIERVLDYMETYKGDCFSECKEIFGFDYGDEYEVPDMSRFRRKKPKVEAADIRQKRQELEAVRKIQGAKA